MPPNFLSKLQGSSEPVDERELVLGVNVLSVDGARAFLRDARCSPSEFCFLDRSVFAAGSLQEPVGADSAERLARVPAAWARTLTMVRIGEALYASGRGESAVELFDYVGRHEASPRERASALSNTAAIAHQLGDSETARQLLRAALTCYPAHEDAVAKARALDAERHTPEQPSAVPASRRLCVGASQLGASWERLAPLPGPGIAHVGSLADLSNFAANSFAEVHIDETLTYFDLSRAESILVGVLRVLRPNGRLTISVPDVTQLAKLLSSSAASLSEELHLLRRLFGARGERASGFSGGLLRALLESAGFVDIEQLARAPDGAASLDTQHHRGVSVTLHFAARRPA